MSVAYVDASALVAVAFDDRSGSAIAGRLDECSRLLASNLLEAELRAMFARERLDFADSLVAGIEWILPDRPLAPELTAVLESGDLRGADLWHVATALYATPDPRQAAFITADTRQQTVAASLGFEVWGGRKG